MKKKIQIAYPQQWVQKGKKRSDAALGWIVWLWKKKKTERKKELLCKGYDAKKTKPGNFSLCSVT